MNLGGAWNLTWPHRPRLNTVICRTTLTLYSFEDFRLKQFILGSDKVSELEPHFRFCLFV